MKIKAKIKDCRLVVNIKTTAAEIVDEKELDRFGRAFIRGFLKPRLVKKNKIEYTGPVGISLSDRFKRPVTKRDFLFIIEQFVVAVQKLCANQMPVMNMITDARNVYINEATKEVQFLYIPFLQPQDGRNLLNFLEMIVYSAKPAEEPDMEYISRFTYFYRNLAPFDISRIESFVLKEDRSVVTIIRKQNSGQSGFMTNKKQHYVEHYNKAESVDDEATGILQENMAFGNFADDEATGILQDNMAFGNFADDEATGILQDNMAYGNFADDEATGILQDNMAYVNFADDEATGILQDNMAYGNFVDDEATGLLCEDENETTLLEECVNDVHYPSLCRVVNDESISVNKPVFRLGKEKSYVDYFVTNNTAVSRSHADIITRGTRYFVIDLNSKNHTYINGQMIPVQTETQINNGDRLRLGNEEFIFYI